jgi:hypothetical protein
MASIVHCHGLYSFGILSASSSTRNNNLKTSVSTLKASTIRLSTTSTLSWTLKHSHGLFKLFKGLPLLYSILTAFTSYLTVNHSHAFSSKLTASNNTLTASNSILWPTELNYAEVLMQYSRYIASKVRVERNTIAASLHY